MSLPTDAAIGFTTLSVQSSSVTWGPSQAPQDPGPGAVQWQSALQDRERAVGLGQLTPGMSAKGTLSQEELVSVRPACVLQAYFTLSTTVYPKMSAAGQVGEWRRAPSSPCLWGMGIRPSLTAETFPSMTSHILGRSQTQAAARGGPEAQTLVIKSLQPPCHPQLHVLIMWPW